MTDTTSTSDKLPSSPTQWIKDLIPDTFVEYDYIMEEVIFAALIDFWENDNGEECLRYQWDRPNNDEIDLTLERYELYHTIYNELKEAYDWAKRRHDEYNGAFNIKNIHEHNEYLDTYKKVDNAYLLTIIKNRQYMWT